MTEARIQRHHDEARQYVRNCTDRQLENIIRDETDRSNRGGEVGEVAAIMLYEARREVNRRYD